MGAATGALALSPACAPASGGAHLRSTTLLLIDPTRSIVTVTTSPSVRYRGGFLAWPLVTWSREGVERPKSQQATSSILAGQLAEPQAQGRGGPGRAP